MKKPRDNQAWLSEKRAYKRYSRQKGYQQNGPYQSKILTAGYKANIALTSFRRSNKYLSRGFSEEVRLIAPRRFCLISNVAESLSFLQKAAAAALSGNAKSLLFDQSGCEETGLSAEILMSVIAEHAGDVRKKIGGNVSADKDLRRKSWSVGAALLDKRSAEYEAEFQHLPKIRSICTQRNYSGNMARDPDNRGKEINKVIAYIEECLRPYGMTLNTELVGRLDGCLAEVIENAETHAGRIYWAMAGFLCSPDNNGVHVCELAICNFGRSIAESMEDDVSHEFTQSQVRRYIELHHGARSPFRGFTTEDLTTVMALQEGISRLNKQGDTRGNGMAELIETFQGIVDLITMTGKGAKAEMALLSGSTHIKFDGQYKLQNTDDGKRVMAFNESGKLTDPPDSQAVQTLKGLYFPGTVLSIRFPIQGKVVQAV